MRAQPEVEDVFAITGLNLLTGTNSSYAATVFIDPQALGAARRQRPTAPQALAARANRIGAGIKEANVSGAQSAADPRYRHRRAASSSCSRIAAAATSKSLPG